MADSELRVGEDTGLDRETKSRIKRWVLGLRGQFEDDFALQLRRYGIEANKDNGGPPEYLSEEEQKTRRRLLAVIRREEQAEPSRQKAIDAYIRDATFTYINRLVGLRCMEARELLYIDGEPAEAITIHGPTVHGGRPRLLAQMRDDSREYRNPDDGEERLWRDGLHRAFSAVTEEIGVLFDPEHDYSILFPSHAVLQEAVRAINEDLPSHVYGAPDFLGWVYQFFNAEEKQQVRKETGGKPRTSHELAVINQFYTPDWIVKFLVDNTLGRIWLQMHPDTRLYWKNRIGDRDPETMSPEEKTEVMFRGVNIDYLVPDTGEDEPIDAKPVAEITLLDPACGTMHFGQYACTLFYEMYLEEAEKLTAGEWEVGEATDPAGIPTAILENNLFGVDIDPRAIQIAALAMLLTTKEQARLHGLDPQSVRVRDMNLVCADSVDLGEEQREKLLEHLDPAVFGGPVPMRRAVEALWQNLEHAGELGSLIQPGKEVEKALEQPIQLTIQLYTPEQAKLGDGPEWGEVQQRLTAKDKTTARDYLLSEVQRMAAGKGNGKGKGNGNGDIMAQLFAQETEKGLRLLEVLGRKYDVVVMNPPYGEDTTDTHDYIQTTYPSSKNDVSTCFVEQAAKLTWSDGYIGAIIPRSYMFIKRQGDFRREVLGHAALQLAAVELGIGVLDDATNRTVASVFARGGNLPSAVFIKCDKVEDKQSLFHLMLLSLVNRTDGKALYRRQPRFNDKVHDRRLSAYWLPSGLLQRSANPHRVEPDLCVARAGVSTADDERFVRHCWEVPSQPDGTRWIGFNKGGEFQTYYYHYDLILRWDSESQRILSKQGNRLASRQHYRKPGVSYPIISDKWNSFRVLPPGLVFSNKGAVLVPEGANGEVPQHILNGLLNSKLARAYLLALNPERSVEVDEVRNFPLPEAPLDPITQPASRIYEMKSVWDAGNETTEQRPEPWLLQVSKRQVDRLNSPDRSALPNLLSYCLEWDEQWSAECQRLQAEIDEIVYELYEITPEDRELIERELGERPAETVWAQMAGRSQEEKRLEHVLRLLSYIVRTACEEDDDGIVPLVLCGGEPTLIQRARAKFDELFGEGRSNEIENEINAELQVDIKGNRNCGPRMTMADWFATRYFDFHVKLYKRRPIFWHICTDDGSFGAIVHYHRFDKNRLQKLRAHYLKGHRDRLVQRINELSGDESKKARGEIEKLEGNIRAADELDRKLAMILNGEEYRIEVPWKSEEEQPQGWDPDIDDGVKVNIGPFQSAGVLAVKKVV